MTAKISNGRRSGRAADGEITVQIAERNGKQVIIIKERSGQVSSPDLSIEITADMLVELKRTLDRLEDGADTARSESESQDARAFAHESEEEFARILDFYNIAWQYEPRTFPIEWDEQGRVASSFTPDFYLPQQDLYIELTTLKQPLVTKKNRKLRRLKELYPEVSIKILYASDYQKLVQKFAASSRSSRQLSIEGES
jgi:hypothetical protein